MNYSVFLYDEREQALWKSVTESSWRYYAWLSLLLGIIFWGLYAYSVQLRQGLIVTGMRDQVSWGIYITNFVFFIGISHVGALLSAILRFSNAEWRRPLTRMAEAITAASLVIGGLMPVVDMGRPERLLNLIRYGRIQSNIIWDILGVTTYLAGSTFFLWILMIPDIALLRDNYPNAGRFRRTLYRLLALGYRNTAEQHHYLEKAILAITLIILPLAISVHTVVSWIFGMTLRSGWHSTIFGPYFVVGALFSGAASVIIAMYAFRRIFHLEEYIKPIHFRNLCYLLFALTITYLYFNINEYLTIGYKVTGHERHLLETLFSGEYALIFWSTQVFGVAIPAFIMGLILGIQSLQKRFLIHGIVIASALVVIGTWLKRYVIIIPTLTNPFLPIQGLPWEWAHYHPTWVEWSITAAAFAGFLLIYTLLAKFFPIISIWETREAIVEERALNKEKPRDAEWHNSGKTRLGVVALLLVIIVGFTAFAAAAKSVKKHPLPTMLTLRVKRSNESPRPVLTITATLADTTGKPIADVPVRFEMKMLFGTLKLGLFPTDEKGKAALVLRDKRFGVYRVRTIFGGNDIYEPNEVDAEVDFGPRTEPSLPQEGILIAPYPTFFIAFPFLLFYGSCWLVFLYAFGWLVLWKMRRSKQTDIT